MSKFEKLFAARALRVAMAACAATMLPSSASAAITYKFTQNAGIGDTLYGAFTSAGLGLETTARPVTFDFTLANPLAADTVYDFGFAGLSFSGVPARYAGNVLDFNFSDGTPISSFSLSQFTAAYPGNNPGYNGRISLATDGSGNIKQYAVGLSAISAYAGPLTAGFTAPTNIQFNANSTTSLAVASITISVLNSSRNGTPDFGGLICTSIAQNCGGSFNSASTGGATGGPTAAVPEPASWALMLLGFGAIGAAMRTRRRVVLSVARALRA